MVPTKKGLIEIEQSEGFSARAYLDTIPNPDVPTIGFGETDGVKMGDGPITRAQAEKRLIKRIQKDYAYALEPFLHRPGFTQNMYDALISFIWNCGAGAVGPTTRVGRNLRLGRWTDAANAMLEWNKSGGQVIAGLTARRQRERKLFLTIVKRADNTYLTKWERDTVNALNAERDTARRHAGWANVNESHLKRASQLKSDLKARLSLIAEGNDHDRPQRRAALKAAIG